MYLRSKYSIVILLTYICKKNYCIEYSIVLHTIEYSILIV